MTSSKILIPVDGSPASLRALDFAVQRLVRGRGIRSSCSMFRILGPSTLQALLGCDARLRY